MSTGPGRCLLRGGGGGVVSSVGILSFLSVGNPVRSTFLLLSPLSSPLSSVLLLYFSGLFW